jgi:hypothetical protein
MARPVSPQPPEAQVKVIDRVLRQTEKDAVMSRPRRASILKHLQAALDGFKREAKQI